MSVFFGQLPEDIEPKQRPLPHRRDSPAMVFKERKAVMAVYDTSGAGFDHRTIKSLIIRHLRRFGAAFDQFRPVSLLHFEWNILRQAVDAPASGKMDAPINAVLKRMPIPAELEINQLQPVLIDQTII